MMPKQVKATVNTIEEIENGHNNSFTIYYACMLVNKKYASDNNQILSYALSFSNKSYCRIRKQLYTSHFILLELRQITLRENWSTVLSILH